MIDRNIVISLILLIILSVFLSKNINKENFIDLDDLEITDQDNFKTDDSGEIEQESINLNKDNSLLRFYNICMDKGDKGEPGEKGDQDMTGKRGQEDL